LTRLRKNPQPQRNPNWEPSDHLKAKVHYLAWRWSMGRYEVIDDLYQEGMLAIWLEGETQAPVNHQLRTAQERMLMVRQQGRSVDGRLNARFRRPQVWTLVSVDRTGRSTASSSPVEEYVVGRATVQEILSLLGRHEIETLGLVYQGFNYREIAARLGQYPHVPYRTMREIRRKVNRYLHSSREEI
jgi:DNA-directed RNA polymerase specialized sigma24 family protein